VLRAPGAGLAPGMAAGQQQQQPAGQAVFQQQMAALRNQLEAMQAQRQQPGAGGQQNQNQAVPNFLNMMGQMGGAGVPPFAGLPGFVPPAAAAAPQQQPQAGAAAGPASTEGAAAAPGAAPAGAPGATAAAGGVRPPFMFPPFPFLPFTVPPPQPPPNFSGLSDTELEEMEGRERSSVEARIRCLRNIQVLLDAAVMEMQQYSAVVARANAASTASTIGATAPSEPASEASSASTAASSVSAPEETGPSSSSAPIVSSSAVSEATAVATQSITSSVATTACSSTSAAPPGPSKPFLSPTETGARPKVITPPAAAASVAVSSALTSSEEAPDEMEKVEKPKENPFEALSCNDTIKRSAEQEEIRQRRLAVFEEQKKRLMKK